MVVGVELFDLLFFLSLFFAKAPFRCYVLGLMVGGLLVDLGEAGESVWYEVCWLGAPGEGQ